MTRAKAIKILKKQYGIKNLTDREIAIIGLITSEITEEEKQDLTSDLLSENCSTYSSEECSCGKYCQYGKKI